MIHAKEIKIKPNNVKFYSGNPLGTLKQFNLEISLPEKKTISEKPAITYMCKKNTYKNNIGLF